MGNRSICDKTRMRSKVNLRKKAVKMNAMFIVRIKATNQFFYEFNSTTFPFFRISKQITNVYLIDSMRILTSALWSQQKSAVVYLNASRTVWSLSSFSEMERSREKNSCASPSASCLVTARYYTMVTTRNYKSSKRTIFLMVLHIFK